MKIVKVNASFSMKKSLGSYEMADIFFAAEAEIVGNENPEEVAQEVHDFCKKLAVEKYNSFTKPVKEIKTAEEEYNSIQPMHEGWVDLGDGKGVFPKVFKHKPFKIPEVNYESDGNGGKKKIIKNNSEPY